MKKLLLSVLTVGIVAAGAIYATGAFFNDTETSTGNKLIAGAIDLKIDSKCSYNGKESEECGTFGPTDLGPTSEKFFNFSDLKPGDQGENTISLDLTSNPAHACLIIENMSDDDLGLTEPESSDGDLTDGVGNGELAKELHFFAWADTNGDNIWESGEAPLFSNTEGPASDVLGGKSYYLNILQPGTTYLGVYWCFGKLTVGPGNLLTCDGSAVTNVSQTDSLTADLRFYVEQARNNPDFVCPSPKKPAATVTSGTGWSAVDLDTTNGQAVNRGGGQQQSEWWAKARNNNGGFEIAIGDDDAVPAGQSTAEATWVGGVTENFTLSYDGAGNATLAVAGETPVSFAVGGVGTLARIGVNVKAPASVTTTVDGLALSVAAPLSDDDVTVTGGTNHLLITGANLNQAWSLTGTFVFSVVGAPHSAESIAVQFSVD